MGPMPKPFASTADLAAKTATLEVLTDGIYAYTAEGDPNVGAIEGSDAILAVEARATPYMARIWLDELRHHTDKPVRWLALTHYHAVRTLGASAFEANAIIAHRNTAALIEERGQADFESEAGRMPRLFTGIETIPGLTRPTVTFSDRYELDLGGGRRVELLYVGRGHTEGDILVWMPDERVLFAGDLVESQAALYTGDAYHSDWMGGTLDAIAALDARVLDGGRGAVARDQGVAQAIEQTRGFLSVLHERVASVHGGGGTLKEAFEAAHAALEPQYGAWPIFEHCMPFNVQRMWDELDGIERPRIWTAERDREVWAQLQD
jgi:glyoxylase-like metal-dependent hydrolase (beta-lactamase superfamily II)